MADRNDASSSMITPTGATGRVHSTADGEREYGGSVVTEFLDAARSAAESLLEEQKRQIADRISGIARALRSAAQPLDRLTRWLRHCTAVRHRDGAERTLLSAIAAGTP